jgi:hypothetical protein
MPPAAAGPANAKAAAISMPSQNFIPGVHPLPGPALGPERFLPICIAASSIPTSVFIAISDQRLTRRLRDQSAGS